MSKSILTHFGIISLLHVALLLWGHKSMPSDFQKNQVPKLGNGGVVTAIRMSLGEVRFQPQIVNKTRTIAQPLAKPVATPQIPATGGNPGGHEFGSGATGTEKFDAVSLYKAELRDRIDKNKFYPPLSKRLGQTGVVVVAFTLLEDGNIINIRIESPSRYERLNDSALDAVKKVVRFKPIPKEVGDNKMDIKVPLKFVTI